MRNLLAFALLTLLAGCDSVVATESVGLPHQEVRTLTGYEYGYCYTCMPGFGKGCGFKFSSFCSCEYKAEVSVQPQRDHYESGKVLPTERVVEIKRLTECE